MPEVSKTVLVEYMPEDMFRLVDDIERYPEFLPWCTGAKVVSREGGVMRATLAVGFRGVRQSFTTENHNTPPHGIALQLVDGPFKSLDGQWRFNDLNGRGCKIELNLAWTFSSVLLGALVGPVFSHIADTMVEAFVKRAGKVYGASRD